MKIISTILTLIVGLAISTQSLAQKTADTALNALHEAAGKTDQARFTSLLTEDAVILGLPDGSRLQGQALRDFIAGSFAQPQSWGYRSSERQTRLSADGTVAWFDEVLEHDQLGSGRGSGVLLLEDGDWKITQYSISVPSADVMAKATTANPPNNASSEAGAASTSSNAATVKPEPKKECRKFRHKTNKQSRC